MIASYPLEEIRGRVQVRDLRAWRLAKGLTQVELEKLSGVTRKTITRHENNNRFAYGATIKRLSRALGITPRQLAEDLPR